MWAFCWFGQLNAVEGYWSSFSVWLMLLIRSCSVQIPRAQCWASSILWHCKSKLFLPPLKMMVRHCSSGTEPASLRRASVWQPSRTHSTSITETVDRDSSEILYYNSNIHKANICNHTKTNKVVNTSYDHMIWCVMCSRNKYGENG